LILELNTQMTIDPEGIPPISSAGNKAVRFLPKWNLYGGICLSVLVVVGILKTLFPLILMGFLLGLIWRQSRL